MKNLGTLKRPRSSEGERPRLEGQALVLQVPAIPLQEWGASARELYDSTLSLEVSFLKDPCILFRPNLRPCMVYRSRIARRRERLDLGFGLR